MSSRIVRSWCVRQPDCSRRAMASSVLPVRTSGSAPPFSSCRNWMTNSTSRMPPRPVFTFRRSPPSLFGTAFDASLERLDAGDVRQAQVAAVNPGFEPVEQLAAQVAVAGDRPGFDVRLPLPGAALRRRSTTACCRSSCKAGRASLRAAAACRRGRSTPKSVDSVSRRIRSFAQPFEELLVADGAASVGLAVLFVQEDEVDVAGVVQLQAAELAEGEDDEAARARRRSAAADRIALRICRQAKSSAASTIASAR